MTAVDRFTATFAAQIAGMATDLCHRDPAAAKRIEEIGAEAIEYVAEIIEADEIGWRRALDKALAEVWATFEEPPR